MLSDKTSSAIVAISDMSAARRFYSDVLGLEVVEAGDDVMVYATGPTQLVVYRSDHAGTNRANAVVFDAGNGIEDIVSSLSSKGVVFEQYDIPGAQFRDGIHHAGFMKLVWFKDPDGNIIHINQMRGTGTPAD
jgi:catechol 2,3-dioxygenase-like lactoylglutathione lyase family enzyme